MMNITAGASIAGNAAKFSSPAESEQQSAVSCSFSSNPAMLAPAIMPVTFWRPKPGFQTTFHQFIKQNHIFYRVF